jgi:hypothetical protein
MHPDFVVCVTWVISFLASTVRALTSYKYSVGLLENHLFLYTVFLRDLSQPCLAVEEQTARNRLIQLPEQHHGRPEWISSGPRCRNQPQPAYKDFRNDPRGLGPIRQRRRQRQ